MKFHLLLLLLLLPLLTFGQESPTYFEEGSAPAKGDSKIRLEHKIAGGIFNTLSSLLGGPENVSAEPTYLTPSGAEPQQSDSEIILLHRIAGGVHQLIAASGSGSGATLAANTFTGIQAIAPTVPGSALVITSGTVTTNLPFFTATQTWNNAATLFEGVKWTFVDTASAAGSLPFRILGGASGNTNLFIVGKDGAATIGSAAAVFPLNIVGTNGTCNLQFTGASDMLWDRSQVLPQNGFIRFGYTGGTDPILTAGSNTLSLNGAFIAETFRQSWLIKTTTYTAKSWERIQTDSSGAAFTINLPAAPAVGDPVVVQDGTASCGTNAVTLGRNGLKINGGTSDFTINIVNGKFTCVYISTAYGWSIK